MQKLNATSDHVIVEIISQNEAEDKALQEKMSKSGLLMPTRDTTDPKRASGPPVLGIVYAIGPKAQEKFGDNIIVGDQVIFDEKKPQGFKWDDKKLLALTMDQIVARLERE
mgnify:CR=1 FL=1